MPLYFNTGTSVTGSTIIVQQIVATQSVDLVLSDATLHNGMRIAAAAGDLPERITTEHVKYHDFGMNIFAIVFSGDSNAFYASTQGTVRKVDFTGSSPVQLWSTNVANSWGLFLSQSATDGDHVWTSRNTAANSYVVVTGSTGTPSQRTHGLGSIAYRNIGFVPGVANRGWVGNSSVLAEFNFESQTPTGRSITGSSAHNSVWFERPDNDGIGSIYVNTSSGSFTTVSRYRESDLVEIGRWVGGTPVAGGGTPGSLFSSELFVTKQSGSILVRNQNDIDMFPSSSMNNVLFEELTNGKNVRFSGSRVVYGGPEIMGPCNVKAGGGNQCQPGICISPNGRYLAHMTTDAAGVVPDRGVLIRNILFQRATWSWTMVSGTLQVIALPGKLGSQQGFVQGYGPSLGSWPYSDRRTRCYYQRATLDSNRVEFLPGETINIAMLAGQQLTIDVEIRDGLEVAGPPSQCYLSDGPHIFYTQG